MSKILRVIQKVLRLLIITCIYKAGWNFDFGKILNHELFIAYYDIFFRFNL